jgi:hypothetical protein
MPSTNTWTNPCWRTLEAKSMALWFHWSIQYTIYIYVYIHINIYYKYYIYMYVVDDNKWSFDDILKKPIEWIYVPWPIVQCLRVHRHTSLRKNRPGALPPWNDPTS